MNEIAEFLRARYQEGLEHQKRIRRSTYEPGDACPICGRPTEELWHYGGDPAVLARFVPCGHETNDPADLEPFQEPAPDPDVVADLEAKLAIVDLAEGTLASAEGDSEVDHYGALSAAEGTLHLLARPFAGHPDHKGEEWAP